MAEDNNGGEAIRCWWVPVWHVQGGTRSFFRMGQGTGGRYSADEESDARDAQEGYEIITHGVVEIEIAGVSSYPTLDEDRTGLALS